MYKYTMFLILAIASLACLQTVPTEPMSALSATSTPPPTESAHGAEPDSGAVFEIPEATQTAIQQCAIVTAVQSLWLRELPSEKSKAISWLPADEITTIKGRVGNWWKVQTDSATGYARAEYLKETECR